MAHDHVVGVGAEEVVHVLARLEEDVDCGSVMVFPLVAGDLCATELLAVVGAVTEVVHTERLSVVAAKEGRHLVDVIAVKRLHSASREGHSEHALRYVRDVKVEFLVLVAVSLSADDTA